MSGSEAEALWRSVYENSLEGVLLTVPTTGEVLAANPQACALLGRTEAEIRAVGREGIAVLDDAARAFMVARDRAGKARGVLTLRRRDGSTFHAEVSSAVFSSPDGTPRTSMTFRDVTAAERSRQALEILADAGRVLANSLELDTTLSSLTRLVVPKLADACVVDLLQEGVVRRVAVAHRDPTRVQPLTDLRPTNVGHGVAGAGVDHALRTSQPSAVFSVTDELLRTLTRDDEHFRAVKALGIRSFATSPLTSHGRTIGALSFISTGGVPPYTERDLPLVQAIAERAALAIDNAQQHRDAVEARRLREAMLSVVSHDLRSPLHVINLNAGLLARRTPGREPAEISAAVKRADRLIQDLLLAAQTETGTIPIDRRLERIDRVFDEVLALHRTIAEERHVSLTIDAGPTVIELKLDRHRIVQLLSNLLGNALKFTPRGGRVTLTCSASDDAVVLAVADTGPGIAPEDRPRIFDRFWQGAHARGAGVGLGLSIARGIAQAHGGSISVDDNPGGGTVFRVRLPRQA